MQRRPRLAAAAVAAALVAAAGCTVAPSPAPSSVEPTSSAPSASAGPSSEAPDLVEVAFGHLAELQRIADENDGNRADPSPGYDASLAYAESVLRAAGYETRRHEGVATTVARLTATLAAGADPVSGQVLPMRGTPNTDGELSAPLRAAEGFGCASEDYRDAVGAIVLVSRGECPFGDKVRAAAGAGAAAVVVYNTEAEPLNGDLGGDGVIPAVGVPLATGRDLQLRLDDGSQTLRLNVEVAGSEVPVVNLIADAPPPSGAAQGEGDVVMLGAHLDSVPEGPGINDNGSGVALTLALAQRLAAEGRAVGLRVGLWAAEEHGLLGSEVYVADLRREGLDVAAYMNLDMVASPNGVVGVYGGGEPLRAIEVALTGADEPFVYTDIGNYSDHAWFAQAGVPVAGLHTGAGVALSQADADVFGGLVGEPQDACYHRACDTLSEVDTPEVRGRLAVIADATYTALRSLLPSDG